MTIQLKVPEIGESITEAQIGDWLKHEGDFVRRDEAVAQVESDKATVEVYAPAGGKLSKVVRQKGDTVKIGEVIGLLEEAAAVRSPAAPPASSPQPAEQSKIQDGRPEARTTKETPAAPPRVEPKPLQPEPKAAVAPPPVPQVAVAADEELVPMSPIRRRIAERLVQAQNTAALLTTFNEIDLSGLNALRQKYREAFAEKHGVKLGLMSFFVKAVIEALKEVPQLNAEVRGEQIVYHKRYDIGIAVGAGKGLVVPVLRHAEGMSFAELEKAIADFARRAEASKLDLAELQGGTFTISNGGIYGSLLSTPIVNPPQSGILGMHAIQDRPVARDGQIVIRPMMYVALTYDHRLVDGREAVVFLKRIKELIEDPARLLIEA